MKKLAHLTLLVFLLSYSDSFTQTFTSLNCGTINEFKIINSGSTALAPFSGLPNKLSNEFGLKSITIYATIAGTIAENQLFFDLQDPSKVQIEQISTFHSIVIDNLAYQVFINCQITTSKETYTLKAIKM